MKQSCSCLRFTSLLAFAFAAGLFSGTLAGGQMPETESDPGEAIQHLVHQAIGSIKAGDLIEGSDTLKGAILLRHGHVLKHYPTPSQVTNADLDWGRQQVEQLLRDRPILKEIVDIDDKMGQWLSEGFAGAFTSSRIVWDPKPPDQSIAVHTLPHHYQMGKIMVGLRDPRKGDEVASAERILGAVWYEIFNMSHAASQTMLFTMATNGDIEKDVFVQEASILELQAARETKAFYAYEILPYFHEKGFQSNPDNWYVPVGWNSDRQAREIAHRDKNRYPWIPFAEYYDNLRSRGLRREAEAKEKRAGDEPTG